MAKKMSQMERMDRAHARQKEEARKAQAATVKPLTADERDGGARFEGQQNAGLDY